MYPERVSSLVLYGSYAKSMNNDDYHAGVDPDMFEVGMQMMLEEWGNCALIDIFAPSMREDEAFRRWWGRYERQSASPGAAVAIQRLNAKLDVRPILAALKVPTLIIFRGGEFVAHVEGSKFLARHIPGAQYVELDGVDYHPYVGDQDAILDSVEQFLTGASPTPEITRRLATLLLVGDASSHPSEVLAAEIEAQAKPFDGVLAGRSRGAVALTFDGPARAVMCALALRDAWIHDRPGLRFGLHVGEVERRGGDVAGTAVGIAEQVLGRARAGDVLISRTLADLLAGSPFQLTSLGAHQIAGVAATWELFAVSSAVDGASRETAGARRGVFRREGDVWLIGIDDASTRVRDMKGFADIAVLLDRRGREVHVSELAGALVRTNPQPLADGKAIAAYRQRLADLADDEAEAERNHDGERVARLRQEREALLAHLSSSVGLRGRTRVADDVAERARKAVRLRIANALKRIEGAQPAVGRHLRASIRTGAFCVYEPVDDVDWQL